MHAIESFIGANPWTSLLIAFLVGFIFGAYFVWKNRKGKVVGSAPDMLYARGHYELVDILADGGKGGIFALKRYWPKHPKRSGGIAYVWRDKKISYPKEHHPTVGMHYTILPCNGFITLLPKG